MHGVTIKMYSHLCLLKDEFWIANMDGERVLRGMKFPK